MATTLAREPKTVGALRVIPFAHPQGCRTYLIADPASGQALALDVHLDLTDAVVERVRSEGWTLPYVVDSHTHADHPSGAGPIAAQFSSTRVAHRAARHQGVTRHPEDGETLHLGDQVVTIRHAPGHTPDHIVLLSDGAFFSGDTLFIGGVARTDFLGGDAGVLFDSIHGLLGDLPDDTVLYPGHNYEGRIESTIGAEKQTNAWLQITDRDEFIRALTANPPKRPANMDALLRLNREGVDIPTSISAHAAMDHVKAGGALTVIDVRTGAEMASEHIEGTHHISLDQIKDRADEVRAVPAPASAAVPHGQPCVHGAQDPAGAGHRRAVRHRGRHRGLPDARWRDEEGRRPHVARATGPHHRRRAGAARPGNRVLRQPVGLRPGCVHRSRAGLCGCHRHVRHGHDAREDALEPGTRRGDGGSSRWLRSQRTGGLRRGPAHGCRRPARRGRLRGIASPEVAVGKHAYVFFLAAVLAGCGRDTAPPAADDRTLAQAPLGATARAHRLGRDLWLTSQPTRDDFARVRTLGVRTVVNLRHHAEQDFDEAALVEALGLRYVHVPFKKPRELTDAVFEQVRRALREFEPPMLVHCSSGNRVAAVFLPWRVLDGDMSIDTAVREAKRIGLKSEDYEKRARAYVARAHAVSGEPVQRDQ